MSRILLIDDDSALRFLFSDILKEQGYSVEAADNGKDGLQLFAQEKPDLVITDIIMPDMDGIEVIMRLKRDYPDVKIIALSAGGTIDAKNYLKIAEGLGAEKVLTKPVEHKQLIETVRELIGE
ncbi:MAG: response regulator [Deltaproteobacteria bacterium]|nr:response regulator [Deltaproteobacteria bacterium]